MDFYVCVLLFNNYSGGRERERKKKRVRGNKLSNPIGILVEKTSHPVSIKIKLTSDVSLARFNVKRQCL